MPPIPSGPPVGGTVQGRVETFDEAGGYGTLTSTEPEGTWFFHCTAIADGSRTIEIGTEVAFEVVAGRLGRYEATNVQSA